MKLFKFFFKRKINQVDNKYKLELESILSENISSYDKRFFKKIVDKIINSKRLKEYFSVECDVDFVNKEILLDNLKSLTEFTKSNYDVEPFACDGSGGIYIILSSKKIGYINSEGGAGIIANSLKDFFSIVTNCGYLGDYAKFNCLKNEKSFIDFFTKYHISRDKDEIKKFIKENDLDNDPRKIYKIFKNAVATEPKLILKTTSKEYVDYEQLFKL